MIRTTLTSDQIKELFKESFHPKIFNPDEYWMIVWIGKLYLDPEANLVFQAFVARICQQELGIISGSSLEYSKGQIVIFPASLLKMLQPGTIFQDGKRLVGRQHGHVRRYVFSIEPATKESVQLKDWLYGQELRSKIGLSSIKNRFRGSQGDNAKDFGDNSRIHVIKNANVHIIADYIIFPATEVARFHWFSSTRLTRATINPTGFSSEENVFYVPESLRFPDESHPYHFLRIRDKMLVRDVARIARLAFSIEARLSAGKIQLSRVDAGQFGSQKEFHIDTSFPFSEKCDQIVFGFYIKLASSTVFLVLEIESCGSSFPFKSLRYNRETQEMTVDLTLPRTEGTGIFPGREDSQENEQHGKEDKDKPKPNVQHYFNAKFDGAPTKKSKIKNDPKFRPAQYVVKKASYSNLTSDIKKLRDPKKVAARKDRPKTRNAENLSTSDNNERDTKSVGLEAVEQTVYKFCEGNYSDLARFSAWHIKRLGGKVLFHNMIDDYGQEDFCDISLTIQEFGAAALTLNARKAVTMWDGSPRRIIAMNCELYKKHFLYVEIEPVGKTAFWAFVKSMGKSNTSPSFLQFNKDDLVAAIRTRLLISEESDNEENSSARHIQAFKFRHRKRKADEHVRHILKILKISEDRGG